MKSGIIANLHIETGGNPSGPAILLLHGVLRQIADLEPIIDRLPKDLGWIAVDMVGHGKSAPASHPYKVRDYCGDVVRLLSAIPRRPLIAFGHSLGAMVAAFAASAAPENVIGAILEDPPFTTMGSRIKESSYYLQFQGLKDLVFWTSKNQDFYGSLLTGLRDLPVIRASDGERVRMSDVRGDEAIQTYARYLTQVDPRVLDPIVASQWLDGYDFEDIASKITSPILLLQADSKAGGMLTDDDATRFSKSAAHCRVTKIEGASHLMHATHADALAAEISTFIDSLRPQFA